jgi:hypothetical protein
MSLEQLIEKAISVSHSQSSDPIIQYCLEFQSQRRQLALLKNQIGQLIQWELNEDMNEIKPTIPADKRNEAAAINEQIKNTEADIAQKEQLLLELSRHASQERIDLPFPKQMQAKINNIDRQIFKSKNNLDKWLDSTWRKRSSFLKDYHKNGWEQKTDLKTAPKYREMKVDSDNLIKQLKYKQQKLQTQLDGIEKIFYKKGDE